MSRRLLMVDHGDACGRDLRDQLCDAGFVVEWVMGGGDALAAVRQREHDLILLDVLLSDRDGFEVCGLLRRHSRSPIIILTSLAGSADKVRGFEMGADDYVTKPFSVDELIARIHAVMRRARPVVDRLVLGGIEVDFVRRRVRRRGAPCHLTHLELEVLRYLAERPGLVVKRDELLRQVWGYPDAPHTRSVDHAINRLRKKIEPDPHNPTFIHTVHGDGYCLSIDPAALARTDLAFDQMRPSAESQAHLRDRWT